VSNRFALEAKEEKAIKVMKLTELPIRDGRFMMIIRQHAYEILTSKLVIKKMVQC